MEGAQAGKVAGTLAGGEAGAGEEAVAGERAWEGTKTGEEAEAAAVTAEVVVAVAGT